MQFSNFNYRNIRQMIHQKYQRFLDGFKIILKGRFSRKQRASFV